MGITAERVTGVIATHGEGPLWCSSPLPPFDGPGEGAGGLLRLVDMGAGDLVSFDPLTGRTARRHVGDVAACVRERRDGGLVIALRHSFALLDPGETDPRELGALWAEPDVRFNDGGCDPEGAFCCGSMADPPEEGRGSVYRLTPSGRVDVVLSGVTISNGLCFTADGRRAYYVDTPTRRIDVVEIDPGGGWGRRRPWVTIEDGAGWPDGMCLDAEGGVWVALWEGAAVRRYDPDGRLDAVVPLPVTFPTCPGFGGPGLTDLYVTTSHRDVPPGREPEAGALFRIQPGVAGAPQPVFAG